MRYTWECSCGEHVIVERKLVDIDIPPEKCDACNNQSITKRIIAPDPAKGAKGFILVDSGVGWPSHGFYNPAPARK